MKATLGIIAALVMVVAVAGVEQASAAYEKYDNRDIRKVNVDGWFWGTGKITNVQSWATINDHIVHVNFDYSKITKIEYRPECKCNVKMAHVIFQFPPIPLAFGGWGDLIHTCVKNVATSEQTCQLGNVGFGIGYRVKIPNTP